MIYFRSNTVKSTFENIQGRCLPVIRVYRWLSPAWPKGSIARGLRMSVLIFLLVFCFWEFFTPFNLFGEPLALIGLELLFWAIIALADGLVIAFIMEKRTLSE